MFSSPRRVAIGGAWSLVVSTLFVFALVTAVPAGADWLVTQYGDQMEIQGQWRVDEGWVYFTEADGREDLLPVEEIDYEASQHATDTMITVYVTSWCGYCRATRELLQELDADFLEKDIETDARAMKEHRLLTAGKTGVPFLKTGRTTVPGFSPQAIRKLVDQQKKSEAGRE